MPTACEPVVPLDWNRLKRRWTTLAAVLLCLCVCPQAMAQIGPPPLITVPPLSQTVNEGQSVTFLVVAVSVTSMRYQWKFNGTNIPGANSSIYHDSQATIGDAGKYSVEVKNSSGTSTADANLTVIRTSLRFQSIRPTTNGCSLDLAGPLLSTYVIEASSDMKTWIPISTNSAPLGTATFLDTGAVTNRTRFYRAILR